ncbi:MAG: 50S ribosomal protein L17 [Lentisphaeria bacterium]|nr:50S ribosomal protein L17 [Lentisphaeria bacterium]
MRHLKHTAKLNRNCGHRKAMLVNLACSLIEHDRIETTVIRAKELRRFVERLITLAKKGGDHRRRLAYAKLKINTPSDKAQAKKAVLKKLFEDLAVRFAARPGGYTRIIRNGARIGDGSPMCFIEFVEADAAAAAPAAEEAPKAE